MVSGFRCLVLAVIVSSGLWAQEKLSAEQRTIRSGSAAEAAPLVMEARRRGTLRLIPDLYFRLEHPVGDSYGAAEVILRSAILDALVKIDETGDGSKLKAFSNRRYCQTKVLAYAMRFPAQRWPLILKFIDDYESEKALTKVAWALAWKHHCEALVSHFLEPGVQLVIRVSSPNPPPQRRGDPVGVGVGGGWLKPKAIPCPRGLGPAISYRLVRGNKTGGLAPLVSLKHRSQEFAILRQSSSETLFPESEGGYYTWSAPRCRPLDRRLGFWVPSLSSLQPVTKTIVYRNRGSWIRLVREEKERQMKLFNRILLSCIKKKWLSADRAESLRKCTLKFVDLRPKPRDPLPDFEF